VFVDSHQFEAVEKQQMKRTKPCCPFHEVKLNQLNVAPKKDEKYLSLDYNMQMHILRCEGN